MFDLHNIVISIPLPALREAPSVSQIDGEWKYVSKPLCYLSLNTSVVSTSQEKSVQSKYAKSFITSNKPLGAYRKLMLYNKGEAVESMEEFTWPFGTNSGSVTFYDSFFYNPNFFWWWCEGMVGVSWLYRKLGCIQEASLGLLLISHRSFFCWLNTGSTKLSIDCFHNLIFDTE